MGLYLTFTILESCSYLKKYLNKLLTVVKIVTNMLLYFGINNRRA
jgi:hypothetical protein